MVFIIFTLLGGNLFDCVSAANTSRNVVVSPDQAINAIREAENASYVAFSAMLDADKAGANIFNLTENFNHELRLLDQAKLQNNSGNYLNAYYLAKNTTEIFNEIASQASQLQDQAIQNASRQEFLIILTVPVAVIIITLTFYVCLRLWRKSNLKGLLRMKVEEAKQSETQLVT